MGCSASATMPASLMHQQRVPCPRVLGPALPPAAQLEAAAKEAALPDPAAGRSSTEVGCNLVASHSKKNQAQGGNVGCAPLEGV